MTAISTISNWVVLVVDDEPDGIEVVMEVLEFYGATVYPAADGQQALDVLDTVHVKPTLIITDLSMPVLDGWGLLKKVRDNPAYQHIPVLALTAHAMPGDKERGLSVGFNSYLTKPVSALTLLQDIQDRIPELI